MCRPAGNGCKPPDGDMTAENCAQLPDVICLDDLDRGKQAVAVTLI